MLDIGMIMYAGLMFLVLWRFICSYRCCGCWLYFLNYTSLLYVMLGICAVYSINTFLRTAGLAIDELARTHDGDPWEITWLQGFVRSSVWVVAVTLVLSWFQSEAHVFEIRKHPRDTLLRDKHDRAVQIIALPAVFAVMVMSSMVPIVELVTGTVDVHAMDTPFGIDIKEVLETEIAKIVPGLVFDSKLQTGVYPQNQFLSQSQLAARTGGVQLLQGSLLVQSQYVPNDFGDEFKAIETRPRHHSDEYTQSPYTEMKRGEGLSDDMSQDQFRDADRDFKHRQRDDSGGEPTHNYLGESAASRGGFTTDEPLEPTAAPLSPRAAQSKKEWDKLAKVSLWRYETCFYVADLFEAWALYQFGRLALELIEESYSNSKRSRSRELEASLAAVTSLTWLGTITFVLVCVAQTTCSLWPYVGGSEEKQQLIMMSFQVAGFFASGAAIYNVFVVERAFHEQLASCSPMLKFLSVKILVSLSFFQRGILVVLQSMSLLLPVTVQRIVRYMPFVGDLLNLSNVQMHLFYPALILFECLLASIMHLWAWRPSEDWYSAGVASDASEKDPLLSPVSRSPRFLRDNPDMRV